MGNQLSKEESIKKSKEMFGYLNNEEITNILSQYKYNVYDAIPALSKENEKKEEENKKLNNEKQKKGEEDYLKKVTESFIMMGKEDIEKKFEENKHDPKATLNEIVKNMSKDDSSNEQERFILAVQEKFPNLTKGEIEKELKNSPNREQAVVKLIELSHNKIFKNLKEAHQNLEDKFIFAICEKTNWVFNEALELCEKCKTVDPYKVLEIQAGTIEYLSKDIISNVEKKQTDPIVLEVQAGTIEYLAEDMEKNIKQLSQLKAKQFIEEDNENKELQEKKRLDLATEAIQPLFHQKIEPTNVEKSDKDSLEFKEVDGKLHATVSLVDATNQSWIGFFKKGESNSNYISYNWLSYLNDRTFICDLPRVNGEYEFRVFKDRTTLAFSKQYSLQGQDSIIVKVEESIIKITWSIFSFDVVKESAWISIHASGEERPNAYRRFSWLKSNSDSISFKKLVHEGIYEARVYSRNNYFNSTLKLKSESIHIKL